MREIEVKGKQYAQTRYAIEALAWATNRRGHNRWASDDVSATIYNYLVQNHVDLSTTDFRGRPGMPLSPHHLYNAMQRLADDGFAKVKLASGRYKLVTEFEFASDVILTGHAVNKLPTDDPIERLKASAHELAETVGPVALPMPEIPFKPYRHDEVTQLLTDWQKRDADAHADYIDRLIDTLKVVVNG